MTGKIKNERKKKKQQNILFRILFLLALAVFLYAAVRLILYGITYWKGSHEYKGLQKYVSEQPKDEISTEENGEFIVDFSGLKELNPDWQDKYSRAIGCYWGLKVQAEPYTLPMNNVVTVTVNAPWVEGYYDRTEVCDVPASLDLSLIHISEPTRPY